MPNNENGNLNNNEEPTGGTTPEAPEGPVASVGEQYFYFDDKIAAKSLPGYDPEADKWYPALPVPKTDPYICHKYLRDMEVYNKGLYGEEEETDDPGTVTPGDDPDPTPVDPTPDPDPTPTPTYRYDAVTDVEGKNPSEEGWYEEDTANAGEYVLTTDTEPADGKTYYVKNTVTSAAKYRKHK